MVRFIFESLNLRQDVQRIQCLLQGISICKPIVLITRSTCVAPSILKSKLYRQKTQIRALHSRQTICIALVRELRDRGILFKIQSFLHPYLRLKASPTPARVINTTRDFPPLPTHTQPKGFLLHRNRFRSSSNISTLVSKLHWNTD